MSERVVVRQNSALETVILAADPHDPEAQDLLPAHDLRILTPYGMLLAGLGACTAIVLHTYAQHHGVDLHEVEIHLAYDRVFADDCEDCEGIDEYRETIDMEIGLEGRLAPDLRHRLLIISRHCPIKKMLVQGIEVNSRLVTPEERAEKGTD
jgi:putative redox protein